jgi:hypothetical protein
VRECRALPEVPAATSGGSAVDGFVMELADTCIIPIGERFLPLMLNAGIVEER